jgi:hypothetical protein
MRNSVIFLAAASALAVALLVAGGSVVAWTNPDTDGDGIFNLVDNCSERPNSTTTLGHVFSQLDADKDGFGNTCDGDFNNNGAVNAQDTSIYNVCFVCAAGQGGNPDFPTNCVAFGTTDCSVTDINDNGFVNAQDTSAYNVLFVGNVVGPSGLPCARRDAGESNQTGRHPCTFTPAGEGDVVDPDL